VPMSEYFSPESLSTKISKIAVRDKDTLHQRLHYFVVPPFISDENLYIDDL